MKPEDSLEAAANLATAITPYLPPPVKGPVQIVGLLVKDALGASHQVTTQNGIAPAAAGREANRQSHLWSPKTTIGAGVQPWPAPTVAAPCSHRFTMPRSGPARSKHRGTRTTRRYARGRQLSSSFAARTLLLCPHLTRALASTTARFRGCVFVEH